MSLIAVDPSVRATGVALFGELGRLYRAYVMRADDRHGAIMLATNAADYAVIELPVIYPGVRAQDPNDLIDVAAVAGAWAAKHSGAHTFVRPAEWKGQVPKGIIAARVFESLDESERAVYRAVVSEHKSLAHNAIDAIGIGLFHLGRMKR